MLHAVISEALDSQSSIAFGKAVKLNQPDDLDRLARVYWFTIDSVLRENGEVKACGTRCHHLPASWKRCKAEFRPL
jgi:phenylalanine-4-hydroxylase